MSTNSAKLIPRDGPQIASFCFGVLLVLLAVAAGVLLNPGSAVKLTGGRYELFLISVTIGLSIGHHLGLAIEEKRDEDRYAAIGAFLTVSAAFLLISYFGASTTVTVGVAAVLFLSMAVLILGYYSGVISDKEEAMKLTTWLAEKASPPLLTFIWLLEAIVPSIIEHVLPAIGFSGLGSAILTGIKIALAFVGVDVGLILIDMYTSP